MPGRGGDVDHVREPCPHRIIDDAGGAFAMGSICGSIWHFFKGARNSPRGARLPGAIDAVKLRAPALGGSFAVWGGLFSVFDCTLVGIRGKEDPWNSIASGAITGGVLAVRSGPAAVGRSAAVGGVLLAIIEGISIVMLRWTSDMQPSAEDIQKIRQEMEEKRQKDLAELGKASSTSDGLFAARDDGLASVGQWSSDAAAAPSR